MNKPYLWNETFLINLNLKALVLKNIVWAIILNKPYSFTHS